MKAVTPVMQDHGIRQKDFEPSGLLPDPNLKEEWGAEEMKFAGRLDAAFARDPKLFTEMVPEFWLYDWVRGRFELVREGHG